jgi:hypothetical protein
MRSAPALSLLLLLSTSCFRTHYENFSPANRNLAPRATQPVRSGTGWQHFFIYGLIPSELTLDARAQCGGAENVHSIQTRQTFLEGLVESVAGFYINIYAPWDGAVYCREKPVTLAPGASPQAPAPVPHPATSAP